MNRNTKFEGESLFAPTYEIVIIRDEHPLEGM